MRQCVLVCVHVRVSCINWKCLCLKVIENQTRVDLINQGLLFSCFKNLGSRWLLILIQGFSGVGAKTQAMLLFFPYGLTMAVTALAMVLVMQKIRRLSSSPLVRRAKAFPETILCLFPTPSHLIHCLIFGKG